jgi:hypothetical protein
MANIFHQSFRADHDPPNQARICVLNCYPKISRENFDRYDVPHPHDLFKRFFNRYLPNATIDIYFIADVGKTLPVETKHRSRTPGPNEMQCLFHRGSSSSKVKIPSQYDFSNPRDRQEYIEHFEASAETSLKCRNMSLTPEK